MKDTFIIRKKYWNQIQNLTGNQRRELMDCIFSYQLDGKYESNDGAVCMLMDIMIDEWKDDDEKYLEVCERNRANGKLGGRPAKNHKNPVGLSKPKKADNDSDSDIKENSISKDILKEKEMLYSSYYGKNKGIDEKVCNKLIDAKLNQGITMQDIMQVMVLYNCDCRIRQDYTYVKKFENRIREFQALNKEQIDEELSRIIRQHKQKKKSDEKYSKSKPCKDVWTDLCNTFGAEKVNSIFKQEDTGQPLLRFT